MAVTKEFISFDQDISNRINRLFFFGLTAGPMLSLFFLFLYYTSRKLGGPERRHSLTEITVPQLIITLAIGLVIGIAMAIYIANTKKDREIVVGLKFNDESKQLTLTTKTKSGTERKIIYKYDDLTLERHILGDGITPQTYQTLTLVKGTTWVGHIFEGHFTWETSQLSAIKDKLKTIKSAR
jgi:hypothetical protein